MKRILFIFIAGALSSLPAELAAQSSESRYNREFVFPLYMRNISLGASPVILRDFMIQSQEVQGLAVTLPQIHFMFDQCWWDFDNAGSFGWSVFLSYGRYKYWYAGNDGYGGERVNVRVGMLQAKVGPTYHYTIRTRLEAYVRAMIGLNISGFRYARASLDYDLLPEINWNAVVGMRYFFSDEFGIYAEGGYTSGLVNAGITYRW